MTPPISLKISALSLIHKQFLYVMVKLLILAKDKFNLRSENFRSELAKITNNDQMEQLVQRLKPAIQAEPENQLGEFPVLEQMEFEVSHYTSFIQRHCQMPSKAATIMETFNFLTIIKKESSMIDFMYEL